MTTLKYKMPVQTWLVADKLQIGEKGGRAGRGFLQNTRKKIANASNHLTTQPNKLLH